MPGKNLPWEPVPGCIGLQVRRYVDRSAYRYRQRIGGQLYVHALGATDKDSVVALVGILRCITPSLWLAAEEDFWFYRIQAETDWLIFEMQP